jgi:hypothetical protein
MPPVLAFLVGNLSFLGLGFAFDDFLDLEERLAGICRARGNDVK